MTPEQAIVAVQELIAFSDDGTHGDCYATTCKIVAAKEAMMQLAAIVSDRSAAVQAEREACAKVADDYGDRDSNEAVTVCHLAAAAIRARSNSGAG